MSQPNKPDYTRPPWEWRPPKGVGAAIAKGTRKINEALRAGCEKLAESRRLGREEQRRKRAEGARRLGQNPVSRAGEADDLASVDSPARTSDGRLQARTGLTGELKWLDATDHATGASADATFGGAA